MLGIIDLLPFLEGWDYHSYVIPITSVTRTYKPLLKIDLSGWILHVFVYANDAYATLLVRWKGPGELEQEGVWNAEMFYAYGFIQQDPAGWCSLYNQPIPGSTFGEYYVAGFTAGYQGGGWPFVKDAQLEGYLEDDSTQNSALLTANLGTIVVIDETEFLRSLLRIIRAGVPVKKAEVEKIVEALR